MEIDLTGQVALVAGADGTLRDAIAGRLAQSGAVVEHAGSPASIRDRRGRLDMLVNADPALLAEQAEPPFNAVGRAIARCYDAAASMQAGRIVNVGSIFGLVPCRGRNGLAAASAALFAQTRSAALELGPRGVLVNGVAALLEPRPHTPLRRGASDDDVAHAVLFLLGGASSYVTGEILRLDGGWSAGFARDF